MAIQERAAGRRGLLRLAMALGLAFLVAGKLSPAQEMQSPAEQTLQPGAQNPPMPTTLTTVQGVVRNATTSAPLSRALVQIEGTEIALLTDGEGHFELAGVSVGPQIIRLRKPGFLDRPYATEDVGYQGDGPAHSVLVVAGMPELNFTLTPTSAIHGRIELSTGDPAQGIQITLLKQIVHNGRAVWAQNGSTKTNGSGSYRFAGLPAGVYALYTQPTLENEPATTAMAKGAKIVQNGYPTVFYPEAREFSGAARIRLKAGDQAEANLRLTLESFYMVKATVILPNGKPFAVKAFSGDIGEIFSPEPVLMAAVLDVSGRELVYKAEFNSATHSVEATLPDGTYTLLIAAARRGGPGFSGQVNSEAKTEKFWGFSELSVEGRAVANLKIPLSPQANWPIHLRAMRTNPQYGTIPHPELKDLVSVTATLAGDAPMSDTGADSLAEEMGPEVLDAISTGFSPHWIGTLVNDRSLCVDSFSAGGFNFAREPLKVALGASPPPMELTLRDDCAKLALTLPPALADFLPGEEPFYTVYVVPDFDTTADIPPMTVHPSSGATLTVDGLTPGSYHVYVFNEPVRLEYRNPAVMAALPTQGQQVTLSAGTTGNLMLEVPGR